VTVAKWARVFVALVLVACQAATQTPSALPVTPVGSSSPAVTQPPGETGSGPADTSQPSPNESDFDTPDPVATLPPVQLAPLPDPTLIEGGTIGQALYDPAMVPQGVVSLLNLLAVEIDAADGTVLRPGAGDLFMTEDEVRGAIEATYQELEAGGDQGAGAVTVSGLYDGLASSLPADYTVDEFANAFNDAYANAPDSLAAGVMLGMPITPETQLLSVQAWLLLVDGFVLRGNATETAAAVSFAGLAPLGPGATGTAARSQPALRSPLPNVDDRDWADLLAGLRFLGARIPFTVQGLTTVHEGHGRPGPRLQVKAQIGRPPDVVSPRTGVVLLRGRDAGGGIPMTWMSYDQSELRWDADRRDVPGLNSPMVTDSSGAVHIVFPTRREFLDRNRNIIVSNNPTLTARVDQGALIAAAYDLPPEVRDAMAAGNLLSGYRDADNSKFHVEWHEDDLLFVCIDNSYNYTFQVGGVAELHRNGTDTVCGGLHIEDDDTYRGVLEATSEGHAEGTAVLGLAGVVKCSDDVSAPDEESGKQDLFVVAEPRGNDFRVLRFYPNTPPTTKGTLCQPNIAYRGGGPFQRNAGSYLPFNDTRWSTPDMGFEIQVPSTYGVLDYIDDSTNEPSLGVCAYFWVRVIHPDPEQPIPTYPPGPPASSCP
jgi:hypothetical protein